jgi:hypothetical protein
MRGSSSSQRGTYRYRHHDDEDDEHSYQRRLLHTLHVHLQTVSATQSSSKLASCPHLSTAEILFAVVGWSVC